MKQLFSVTLPLELSNGNSGRGHSHWQSAKRRGEYEQQLRKNGLSRFPLDSPAHLTLTRILGVRQRLWDSDSVLRGSAKELIDALVAVGWFHDDSPKWLEVAGKQDASQRHNGPAVRLEVSV